MKIAICFYGLDPTECWKNFEKQKDLSYKFWKDNVFDVNDNIDVFIHSWSVTQKNKLLTIYKPKKYKIEQQKDFKKYSYLHSKSEEKILNKHYNMSWGEIQYSSTYSMKESVNLKKEYEKEHNFEYDFVMLTRIDLLWLVNLDFKTLNPNNFYVPIWGKNNINTIKSNYKSILGNWYISNSNNINKFSLLYDNLDKYLNKKWVSMHFIFKTHINTITEKIEYKYLQLHCDKQRYSYNYI